MRTITLRNRVGTFMSQKINQISDFSSRSSEFINLGCCPYYLYSFVTRSFEPNEQALCTDTLVSISDEKIVFFNEHKFSQLRQISKYSIVTIGTWVP